MYRSHRSVGRVPNETHANEIRGKIPPLIEDSPKIDYLAYIFRKLCNYVDDKYAIGDSTDKEKNGFIFFQIFFEKQTAVLKQFQNFYTYIHLIDSFARHLIDRYSELEKNLYHLNLPVASYSNYCVYSYISVNLRKALLLN